MAGTSNIEWTGSTWNPIAGCTVISPGCRKCYAMRLAARLARMGQPLYAGLTTPSKAGPVWTGEIRVAPEATLLAPLRRRKPTTWFVNSMSDLFHEAVPDAVIDRVFAVMAMADQHTFQVLTKRSARMRAYMADQKALKGRWSAAAHAIAGRFLLWEDDGHPLPNVWLGVSTEDQERADERVPDLLATPAAVRFVSAEPLLGPIRLDALRCPTGCSPPEYCNRCHPDGHEATCTWNALATGELDWVIVGGESGPGARPMDPAWARSIRDQCATEGGAFFMKQMSGPSKAHMPPIPPDLMVRQMPALAAEAA